MKIKTIKIEIASDDFDNIDMGLFIKSIRKQIKKIIKEEMSDNNVAIDIFEENKLNDFQHDPHYPYKYDEVPPSYPINPCAPPYVITCMDSSNNEQITINNTTLLTELKEII